MPQRLKLQRKFATINSIQACGREWLTPQHLVFRCKAEAATLQADLEAMTDKSAAAEAALATASSQVEELTAAQTAWASREKEMGGQLDDLKQRHEQSVNLVGSLQQEMSTLKQAAGASTEAQLEKLCEVSDRVAAHKTEEDTVLTLDLYGSTVLQGDDPVEATADGDERPAISSGGLRDREQAAAAKGL